MVPNHQPDGKKHGKHMGKYGNIWENQRENDRKSMDFPPAKSLEVAFSLGLAWKIHWENDGKIHDPLSIEV